jgi:histidine kinase/DNA gyrase B/HSP90-like ATPase
LGRLDHVAALGVKSTCGRTGLRTCGRTDLRAAPDDVDLVFELTGYLSGCGRAPLCNTRPHAGRPREENVAIAAMQEGAQNGNQFVEAAKEKISLLLRERKAVISASPLPRISVNREQVIQVFQSLLYDTDMQGPGLGLATCKKILEPHGGRIWCETKLGGGASLVFSIPKVERKWKACLLCSITLPVTRLVTVRVRQGAMLNVDRRTSRRRLRRGTFCALHGPGSCRERHTKPGICSDRC